MVTAGGETLVKAKASEVTRGFLYHRPLGEPAQPPRGTRCSRSRGFAGHMADTPGP